jgi:hypothetical protein
MQKRRVEWSKRRVKQVKEAAQGCGKQTPDKSRDGKDAMEEYSRLGAGLGAAGLASGFAASHFE